MRFKVTETQRVRYAWEVDADSEAEAIESATDGVPEDAASRLLESETEAEAVDGEGGPTLGTEYSLASPDVAAFVARHARAVDQPDDDDVVDYDAVAERQGWDDATRLDVLRRFIGDELHASEALGEFAQRVAAVENDTTGN